jgi:hypothetical protein
MAQYSSFGGVMLWDASQAYGKVVAYYAYALVNLIFLKQITGMTSLLRMR